MSGREWSKRLGGLSFSGETIPGHLREFYQQLFAFVRTGPLRFELLQRRATILHLGDGDLRSAFMCRMHDHEEND